MTPFQNDADCGTTREDLDRLVLSETSHEGNMDKLLQSLFVDASHVSYTNGNFFYLTFFMGSMIFVVV